MVNNGSLHYDHDKDGANTELAGCESQFRNKQHDTYVAVRYQNYKLTVSTDIDNKNEWKECFSVDHVKLPTRYYFGFSAATGDLSDNHDIFSVKVYKLDSERRKEIINPALIEPAAETFAPHNGTRNKQKTMFRIWRFDLN
jgi:mannose-binding lectin 2